VSFDDAALRALINKVASHAMSLGLFDSVNTHEPKNAPGSGLSCAIWLQSLRPTRSSGLSATSVNLTLNIRIYTPMMQEPEDDIDLVMGSAAITLMNAYSGDFDLGASVRDIDLLGMDGTPMSAQAGYLTIGSTMERVIVITLPIIINDMFLQAG
jgi:hypothetical protein